MKILLAEDDAFLRQLLRVTLRRSGHEVVEAEDGQAAWDVLQKERVRVAIVDWMMPRVDGPDLIRRIRGAGWPGYTYIILLTARNDRQDVLEGLSTGADDYLTKPFHREELLARLGVATRIVERETKLRESLAREEELAMRDSLTGLLNRRATQERTQAELNRAMRERNDVGLVMVDIDHFKAFNDDCGHVVGDRALCQVGEILRGAVRDYDFVGRWGGEEFLVVLPGASLAQAAAVAERIRSVAAGTPVPLDGGERPLLQLSLGVTAFTAQRGPRTLDQLLEEADEALYRAKALGRNRACVAEVPVRTPAPGTREAAGVAAGAARP
jgi:two-component system chemotaxis response regulator CheY